MAAQILPEIDRSLWSDLLDLWLPACVSPSGGFHQEFARDWSPTGAGSRFLVFQSRMIWMAATAAETGDPRAERYSDHARHGVRFLADVLFDPPTGAFAWMVDADGRPTGPHARQRHAYGMAFAIYGLAATARALRDDEALSLAQRAFGWLETHHHDKTHLGYFECTDLRGAPILAKPPGFSGRPTDGIGTPYGQKSQNTHLHLLEAFAELYRVWPDPLLGERLEELLNLFLRELYAEPGWLHGFVERDWRPVPGPISHGHDVEAAHLMLDAADALGRGDDPAVAARARALVDYALDCGWDAAGGGFFYAGTPDGRVADSKKTWWVQGEGLLALARMRALTGDARYDGPLAAQWEWIRRHQIDPEFGGWYEDVSPSGQLKGGSAKGHSWKEPYHEGRGLLFTLRLLSHPDTEERTTS